MAWQMRWLVVLGAVCLGLLSAAVFTTSGTYKAYQQDLEDNRRECDAKTKTDGSKKSKECQTVLYRTFDDPVALLTGALTIATIALFVVTLGLFIAASRQGADAKEAVGITRATAERQLRAYVGIQNVIIEEFTVGKPAYINIVFKNFGQTPARFVRDNLQCGFGINIWNADTLGTDPGANTQARTIWPGSTTVGRTKVIPEVSQKQIEAFRLGITFSLNGRITYVDTFGHKRRTNVTMMTDAESRNFIFAPAGNDIT